MLSAEAAQRAIDLALEVESFRDRACIVCARTELRLHRDRVSRVWLCHSCWCSKNRYWRNIVRERFR